MSNNICIYPLLFTCNSNYANIFLEKSITKRLQKLFDEYNEINDFLSSEQISRKKRRNIVAETIEKKYINIYEAYIVEMRVRWQLKRLVVLWRKYIINKKTEPVIDLVTLQEVEKPVYIYDKGRRYAFEAKTLSQTISSSLLHQSSSFAQPLDPKNIYTNKHFSYIQLVSIYYQLQSYGYMSWSLCLFKEADFRITRFLHLNYRLLTLKAIKYQLDKTDTEDSIEMIINFVETVADSTGLNLTDRKRNVLTAALEVLPNHPVTASLRSLTYADLEADIMGNSSSPFITFSASRYLDQLTSLSFHPEVMAKLQTT